MKPQPVSLLHTPPVFFVIMVFHFSFISHIQFGFWNKKQNLLSWGFRSFSLSYFSFFFFHFTRYAPHLIDCMWVRFGVRVCSCLKIGNRADCLSFLAFGIFIFSIIVIVNLLYVLSHLFFSVMLLLFISYSSVSDMLFSLLIGSDAKKKLCFETVSAIQS